MVDLIDLGDVKEWLAIPPAQTQQDALLSELITATSADFLRAIGRTDFAQDVYTEVREGDGGTRLALRHWPIASVLAVTVAGTPIAASPDEIQPGWKINADLDPERRNQLYLVGGATFTDTSVVVVNYAAGYAATPSDVAQAVTDWVAMRFRGRLGQGVRAQSDTGGEHVNFAKETAMPATTERAIEKYERTWPSLDKYQDDRNYKITRITRTDRTVIKGPVE